jgi:hypothetical protein
MNTVPTPPQPIEPPPTHPSWCASDRCSAPDRLAERGLTEADVPMTRRGSHYARPFVIPISREAEVQITLELFNDVFAPTTDMPEGVQLSYFNSNCGHAGTLLLVAEQMAPLATAFTSLRDAFEADRNPLLDRVAEALRVLGCVDRTNADSLLFLSTVHLTAPERNAVLAQFAPASDR